MAGSRGFLSHKRHVARSLDATGKQYANEVWIRELLGARGITFWDGSAGSFPGSRLLV